MFIDSKISKTSKTKYTPRLPTYEMKYFPKQLRKKEKSYWRVPNNMCRPHTPGGGACPSLGECGLDLVTQLQRIKYEDGEPGNLTVQKPGRH